jgi:ATP-dependent RNA helicase DeaD
MVHPPYKNRPQNSMPFLRIAAPLAHALAARGYEEPTPVQAAILQNMALGRDLLCSAQTDSGKIVAFGLAIAADLLGKADALPLAGVPLAMVLISQHYR